MALSILFIVAILAITFASRKLFVKQEVSCSGISPIQKPISWFSLVSSVVATQIGASSILYTAECAFTDGIFAILYPLGTMLGVLALGLGIGARIQRLQLSSISDLFEKYYGSGTLKKISSVITIASLLGLLVAHAVALRDFLSMMGVDQDLLFIAGWFVIIAFSLRGNLKVATRGEIVQALLLISLLSAAYLLSPHLPSLSSSVRDLQMDVFEEVDAKLTAYLLMPCFFVFLEPETIKTTFLSRSKREISAAVLFSGIIMLAVSCIPVYYSIEGKALGLAESTNGFVRVVGEAANPTLALLCSIVLLIVLVSGASSLLKCVLKRIKTDFQETPHSHLISSGWTLALGGAALVASYSAEGVAQIILESYELVVVCLLVPLAQAVFSRKPRRFSTLAAGLAMFFGGFGFCACRFFSIAFFPELISLILSWLGFIVGKTFSRRFLHPTKN